MNHYVQKCTQCGAVIAQCKCMSCDKTVVVKGLCAKCTTQTQEQRSASSSTDSKLKVARLKAGIGQVELARRIGFSQAMISQLESGCRRTDSETMEIIAKELQCNVEDISVTGEPSILVQLMRNCKSLTYDQLRILNEVAIQFSKTRD